MDANNENSMKEKYSKVKAGELFALEQTLSSDSKSLTYFLKLHNNRCVNLDTYLLASIQDNELVIVLTNHKLTIANHNVSH